MSKRILSKGWFEKPLGELADPRRGITYSTSMLEAEQGGISYVNMKSFLKGGGFNQGGTKSYAGFHTPGDLVGPRDLLIANTDVTAGDIVGVPALLPEDLVSSSVLYSHHVTRLRVNDEVTVPFLYYLLCLPEYRSHMLRIARGTTVLMLDMHALKRIPIRAPILETTQNRIAEVLSAVDEAIEHTESLIAKLQQMKAGLMHDLFTRGVAPGGKLRPPREEAPELYQPSPLGWIPNEWETSSCGKEFTIDAGITLGPHRRPNRSPYPYLRVANVHRQRLVLDDISMLEAADKEIEEYKLRTFDLLVVEGHANRNEIGRCAMVHNDAEGLLFQNHLFRLRVIRVSPSFALLWLNSFYSQRYWEANCATSSGLNTINRTLLSALPVFVPKPSEQEKIVDLAFGFQAGIDAELNQAEKLRQLKQGLMHDLLNGTIHVTNHS